MDALADLPDGARIAVSGFGQSAGSPVSLLAALLEHGARDLCLVGNTIPPGARPLFEHHRVRQLIMSFTARAGAKTIIEDQIASGEVAYELVPQGTRGGGGVRQKYGNPMPLDDVAVDFPDMPIIMAHPSFPWQDEALSIAIHKPQVYIDLSGWSPKYFPPILIQYANTLLKEKILFGSDYPVLAPERWMEEFEKLPIKPEVRPLILKENAAKLLQLK